MTIHQIQMRYVETEDRLLLRLSTTDDCEFRFWLTRRFTLRLWSMLVQMLQWDDAVRKQVDPTVRHEVLDLQHEGYAQQADYSTSFEERPRDAPRRMPLGGTPVLLATAQATKRGEGIALLRMHPLEGQGIDITVDTRLLHLFMRLLREQVAATDWGIELALHEPKPPESTTQDVPRRVN